MNKRVWASLLVSLFILFLPVIINAGIVCAGEPENIVIDYDIYIVGDAKDEYVSAYSDVFASLSLRTKIVTLKNIEEVGKDKLIVVPNNFADNKEANVRITEMLKKGANLLTDSPSELSAMLGVELKNCSFKTQSVRYLDHDDLEIKWPQEKIIQAIDLKPQFKSLGYDNATLNTVAVAFNYGEGTVIYLATDILDEAKENFVIYPFLHEFIRDIFALTPHFKAKRLITFLDWGFYYDKDPYAVAKDLSGKGISEIHISGWYAVNDYYLFVDNFIDACHSEGILVYCWLELPMVNKDFWEKNVEYREKTTNLEDAQIDWRYLMALDNPACLEAAFDYYKEFIGKFNFDGVNLAELYYDYPVEDVELNPYSPKFTELEKWMASNYTPMNDFFRETYKRDKGYDPYFLFVEGSEVFFKDNPELFFEYLHCREKLITKLNGQFIEFIKDEEIMGKSLDIVITQIDSFFDETVTSETGVNSKNFIEMSNDYNITLCVEDPFPLWKTGPGRYKEIASHYIANGLPKKKFILDINIVNRNGFETPTAKQTGLEFIQLLSQAAKYANQVCIYAADTPYEYDYKNVEYALASQVKILNDNIVSSTVNMLYLTDTLRYSYYVNDKLWPVYNQEGIILLPGENKVQRKKREGEQGLHILDINTEMESIAYSQDGIIVINDKLNTKNVFLKFNKIVKEIYLDGEKYEPQGYLVGNNEYRISITKPFTELFIKESEENHVETSIVIQGRILKLKKEPFLVNGNYFMAIDDLVESVNGEFSIHEEFADPTVFAGYAGYVLWAQVNNKNALANGKDVLLQEAPKIFEGRIYLPIRFVYETFGYEVVWSEEDSLIFIN